MKENKRGMILAIDMGNTNIVIGCIDNKKIYFEERISTDHQKTELEYAVSFKTVLELHGINPEQIDGAILSSVVPQLNKAIREAVEKVIGICPLLVGAGIKTGLNIRMDQPRSVGSDLIVDAVAALNFYGAPAVIIDTGTATTFSVIDENKNYVGGIIIPGLQVSVDSLVSRTAQLPRIALEAPDKVIGKNTVHCMQSGAVYGYASMIDGLITRVEMEAGFRDASMSVSEPGRCKVIATGGLARVIIPVCERKDIIVDNELLLKGLKVIYDKNVEA
jgi:type III pantothenate kinase